MRLRWTSSKASGPTLKPPRKGWSSAAMRNTISPRNNANNPARIRCAHSLSIENSQVSMMLMRAPPASTHHSTAGSPAVTSWSRWRRTSTNLPNWSMVAWYSTCWPGLLDHVAGVRAQVCLQLPAQGLRVAGGIAVQRRQHRRLRRDGLVAVGEILVGGRRDQAEQQAVEDTGGGEHHDHHVVLARLGTEPAPHAGPQRDNPDPGQPDEHAGKHQERQPDRQVIDPVEHAAPEPPAKFSHYL